MKTQDDLSMAFYDTDENNILLLPILSLVIAHFQL